MATKQKRTLRPDTAKPEKAPKADPKPVPPPARLFLVRCTFVGEVKKQRVDGSFRFVGQSTDAATLEPKLAAAVRKLRRSGELPAKCDVYVEFILELGGLRQGLVADFERWQHNPRKFENAWIAFSDECAVHETGQVQPAYRFGSPATPEAPVAAPAPSHQPPAHQR